MGARLRIRPVFSVAASAISALLLIAPTACDWARDAAGLVGEIERRYPGSRVEIDDRREGGTRTVAVTIVDPRFGADEEVDLAEHAREVAILVQRRYELVVERDTVAVMFRSETRAGPVRTRRNAQFVYPVVQLMDAP